MDYFSLFTIFSACYSILPIIITLKMTVFYIKNRRFLNPNTLHPVLYLQFLIMQFLNIFHVVTSFLTSRIPNSGLLDMSEICEKENYIRFLVFLSYGAVYAKNFSTTSFCLTRVFILFMKTGKEVSQFVYLTLFLVPIAFLLALPRNLIHSKCILLDSPFPNGSVMLVSESSHRGLSDSQIIEAVFYPSAIVTIVVLNFLMFWKLWQSRKLSTLVGRKFDRNAERSLTITMILILLPVIINSSIAISDLFNCFSLSLYVIRPWMIDARCHIIVCYFYFTHPIFKKLKGRVTVMRSKETK